MDPATVAPPSPPPSPPPAAPQNPHTPTDALTTTSPIDCFQKGHRSMENFKAVAVKLAGRLLPPNRSLIDRRFDDIVPHELLVPDHPPYADMILTALWELKAEGGSSEEDISHFIEKEYHELPWAHATILNYHLRDLCKKGTITMTRDRRYIRGSSITKAKHSPSPCPSSSSSSSSSDPSTSISTSPTSSSSSMSWAGPYQRKKRRKIKRRGKTVQLRGRDRGQQRRRARGRGRGRSGPPMMIHVGQRRSGRRRFDVEGRNKGQEPEQENEDQHEVTSKEVEDYSTKDKDLPDVIAKISKEESSSCEQIDEEQSLPQQKYNVTWIGRRARKRAEEDEIDFVNVQSDEEVTVLDVDVSNAKVDEHVVQLEEKEEKRATDMEHNRQEENQLSDIVEFGQTLGEERVMNDESPSKEQDSAMMPCEAQVTAAVVEKPHDDTFEEQIQPEQNNDKFQTHEQEKGGDEQKMVESSECNKQPDCLTKEKVETLEQSADLHNDDDDDDVTEEQIHPQEQCVEKTEESPQPCDQDQLKNVEVESAEQEENQAEVNLKESVLAEVQQEQFDEMVEQQNQPSIQQTETSEKDSLQEKNNPLRNEENTTSSGSTSEGLRRPSRPVLRSSSKKEGAAPNSKKQLELVTPVRRSLRSHKTDSEAAVRTEDSDHSKELVTHSGRTRSSKRKPGIVEAGQVSNRRKTRRTGL